MGKKKEAPAPEKVAPPPPPPAAEAAEEEDSPVIKQLKELDDKYCKTEVEMEKEIEKLRKKYDERQAPLLEERRQVLSNGEKGELGTPGCPDFWLEAMRNSDALDECITEGDEPVLKYLDDIKHSDVDASSPQKGTRIEFIFKENPYFTNTSLWFEAHTDFSEESYKPYKDPECIEVKSCEIDWKAGKNVTVEKKAKETKQKGKNRNKGKAKEEPVPSFFRLLFNNVKRDADLPDALECMYEEEDEDEDPAERHCDNIENLSMFIKEGFVKYAVRFYTGEACDKDDDSDDEDSESEDDDDDDEDDEDSADEPPIRTKGRSAKKGAKSGGGGGGAAGEGKTEECKQQ